MKIISLQLRMRHHRFVLWTIRFARYFGWMVTCIATPRTGPYHDVTLERRGFESQRTLDSFRQDSSA